MNKKELEARTLCVIVSKCKACLEPCSYWKYYLDNPKEDIVCKLGRKLREIKERIKGFKLNDGFWMND